jgi:Transcriptional regulator containing an amidase domain and an AraC-type DNA-binding HTH domain
MPEPASPRRFIFVLLDQFTMLCFSSAVEALRIANRMSGQALYEWVLVGEGGGIARCSAGIGYQLDGDLDEVARDDVVLLCGGIDVQAATTKRMIGWSGARRARAR